MSSPTPQVFRSFTPSPPGRPPRSAAGLLASSPRPLGPGAASSASPWRTPGPGAQLAPFALCSPRLRCASELSFSKTRHRKPRAAPVFPSQLNSAATAAQYSRHEYRCDFPAALGVPAVYRPFSPGLQPRSAAVPALRRGVPEAPGAGRRSLCAGEGSRTRTISCLGNPAACLGPRGTCAKERSSAAARCPRTSDVEPALVRDWAFSALVLGASTGPAFLRRSDAFHRGRGCITCPGLQGRRTTDLLGSSLEHVLDTAPGQQPCRPAPSVPGRAKRAYGGH
jgi:hypothetical protein